MVENELKPHRCLFCNSSFSVEILSKIEDDKGDVYCENCGDIIRRVNNKYNFNPPDIAENEFKTKTTDRPVKLRKKIKQNPEALNYPIGRVFYDTDFPLTFKSNLIIVFSRLICYSILRLEHAGQIDLSDSEPSENVINDLYMATRIVQNKRVKSEFLINLRESSIEEFEGNLKKLQAKIQSNRQYLEDFHVYSRWLIRRVFGIIAEKKPNDQLTIFEKTILNDVQLLNIDGSKLPAKPKKTTHEKNGELEKSITYDLSLTNSITYEDYLSLIETREDISVGMTRTEFYTTLVNRENTTQSEITLKWKCTKKQHAWQASYHSVRTGDGCPRCPKGSKAITKEEFEENAYNAINLLDDLKVEVSKLVPKSEKPKGKLSNEKLSECLGFEERYVRVLKSRIKSKSHKAHNPNFTFSDDQLAQMIENLEKRFGGKKIQNCIKKIEKYKISNNILEYRHQQWQIHNPYLKFEFFKKLDDTNKGYYFGLLLADGLSDDGVNIGLSLEKNDKNVIIRFRKALGISNKIEHVVDKRKKISGNVSEGYRVRVGCKPMLDDLKNLGFFDFKEGKSLPKGFFTKLDRNVALSILCGFYDGDGEQGSTKIFNTNRNFLEQVKREFNIRYNVGLRRKGGKNVHYSVQGREYIGDLKDNWYLSLGADIFNEMMESVEESMERKRKYYPLSINKYAYENLKELIKNKSNLEDVIRIAPVTALIKKLGVSFETFKKLCNEWNVRPLPHSYWKRFENKNWKADFEEKFQTFKEKYLGDEL